MGFVLLRKPVVLREGKRWKKKDIVSSFEGRKEMERKKDIVVFRERKRKKLLVVLREGKEKGKRRKLSVVLREGKRKERKKKED